jgi:hypothetical protein
MKKALLQPPNDKNNKNQNNNNNHNHNQNQNHNHNPQPTTSKQQTTTTNNNKQQQQTGFCMAERSFSIEMLIQMKCVTGSAIHTPGRVAIA